MTQITQQREILTDAGTDRCLEAASRALDAVRANPQADDRAVTGAVGSYGAYNMHDCKNHEDLPVALTVTIDDHGAQRMVTVVAESRWPFETPTERTVGQYGARCEQLVARLHDSISEALAPVGIR